MKKIIFIILEVIVIFLIAWFVLGYINLGRITKGEKPIFVVKEQSLSNENGSKVHVYDNIIYKIVVYEKEQIIYSLKLWFMEDI